MASPNLTAYLLNTALHMLVCFLFYGFSHQVFTISSKSSRSRTSCFGFQPLFTTMSPSNINWLAMFGLNLRNSEAILSRRFVLIAVQLVALFTFSPQLQASFTDFLNSDKPKPALTLSKLTRNIVPSGIMTTADHWARCAFLVKSSGHIQPYIFLNSTQCSSVIDFSNTLAKQAAKVLRNAASSRVADETAAPSLEKAEPEVDSSGEFCYTMYHFWIFIDHQLKKLRETAENKYEGDTARQEGHMNTYVTKSFSLTSNPLTNHTDSLRK